MVKFTTILVLGFAVFVAGCAKQRLTEEEKFLQSRGIKIDGAFRDTVKASKALSKMQFADALTLLGTPAKVRAPDPSRDDGDTFKAPKVSANDRVWSPPKTIYFWSHNKDTADPKKAMLRTDSCTIKLSELEDGTVGSVKLDNLGEDNCDLFREKFKGAGIL